MYGSLFLLNIQKYCAITYLAESNVYSSKFVFIILAKNEESTISNLIKSLRNEATQVGLNQFEIILVDDSTDATPERAREQNIQVLSGGNRGLGFAYRIGLAAALNAKAEYIVSLDGDGQVEISELKMFIQALQDGGDLVVGSRFKNRISIGYTYPKINHIGSRLLAQYLRFMTKQPLTDSHGGFRAMSHAVAVNTEFYCNHTYVQETLIEAAEAGFKIIEISSLWNLRQHGGSRVVASIPRYIKKVGPHLLLRLVKKLLLGKSR